MKLVKWLLGILLVLVLLAVVAAVVALFVVDPNAYKPQIAAKVKETTGRELVIGDNMELSIVPWLGVQAGGLSLSNAQGFGDQPMARIGELDIRVKLWPLLSSRVEVDTVVLRGLELNLARNKQGKSNWDDLGRSDSGKASESDAQEQTDTGGQGADVELAIQGVQIEDARLVWDDAEAGNHYEIDGLRLVTGEIRQGEPVPLEAGFKLERRAPELAVDLSLKGTLTFDQTKPSFSIPDLNLALDVVGDEIPQGKVKLAGTLGVAGDAGSASLQPIKLKLDDSNIEGFVKLANFTGPAIRAELAIDELNLDRYLPKQEEGATAQSGTSAPAASSTASSGTAEENPLAALRGLDLEAKLSIGKLQANNLKVSDMKVQAVSRNGVLRLNPMSAQLYEGSLQADATLDARGAKPKVKAKQDLTGIQIGPLLMDLTGEDRLVGSGDVHSDVTLTGLSEAEVRRTLNGTASIVFRDGAYKGVNLAQLIRNAEARIKGKEVDTTAVQQTDFSELTGSARITNGVIDNQDLTALSPFLRINGKGQVNLPEDSVNYLVITELVTAKQGQGGKSSDELAGLPIPVRFKGALASPSPSVDLNAVLSAKAKQQVEEKKEEIKEKVEEEVQKKLGDKLKGLFGK